MKRTILVASLFALGIFGFGCSSDDALSACSPGQKKCADNSIVSCMDNGSWGLGVACIAPNNLCDASTLKCVAEVSKCKEGDKICNGNTLLKCQIDGTWDNGVECSNETPRCDAQLLQCVAIIKDCKKDEKKCSGNILHLCSAAGTWDSGVECKAPTPICDATALACVASVSDCKKDDRKCSGNVLHLCSAAGTWDAGLECTGNTPICDATTLACVASVSDCKKDEKKCSGNILHLCSAAGTWDSGVECKDPTPVCDAATQACIRAVACKTNDKKCLGNVLYTCKRNGAWDTGLECKDPTPICDATKLECVQPDICKIEEDCKDLTTTCINKACLKIGLKDLQGPKEVQEDVETDFILSLNAKVRSAEGITVKLKADKKEVSINGVAETTNVVVPKGADQIVLKVKINLDMQAPSRSYMLSASYENVTLDARFNFMPASARCVGNMILKGGKEPSNCPKNQVCVKGSCVNFELISMEPANKSILSHDKDYMFIATANAPARESVQLTPNGVGLTTQYKSFNLSKGDDTIHFMVHASGLLGASKDAQFSLVYNDNMDVLRTLTQSYVLSKCKDGETKCAGANGVLVCNKGQWAEESSCAKSQICLPSTQACGTNTLLSISPYFSFVRPKDELLLTIKLDGVASSETRLFIKTSSDSLTCDKIVVPSGTDSVSITCRVNSEAALGQLITIDVYDSEILDGKSLGKAIVWLSALSLGGF